MNDHTAPLDHDTLKIMSDSRETSPTLKIRRVNHAAPLTPLGPGDIGKYLKSAAMLTAGTARAMVGYGDEVRTRGWINTFAVDATLWGAGDPCARYHHGSWTLGARRDATDRS